MRILSYIIWSLFIFFIGNFSKESPHGKDFKLSCNICHTTNNWSFDKKNYSFDHASTKLALSGQHKEVDCRLCHKSLVFSEIKGKSDCVNCHNDIHNQSLGNYCDKCHTTSSWIVNNITQIHQQNRFPLIGVHSITECNKCHKSESLFRYDILGTECVDCHKSNYLAATKPSHVAAGFSTDCSTCHNIYSYQWGSSGFSHNIFPLTQGHANVSCTKCHVNGNYTNISTDCYSCHQNNYNSATNPVHTGGCFSKNCLNCHTTAPGWKPVTFQHNVYFALTLGHANVQCNKCHTSSNCTAPTDCYACHKANYNATTSPKHVSPCYSTNCISCHTTNPGWKPSTFQHQLYFPISSGKHSGYTCIQCHTNPNDCSYSCTVCHGQSQMNSEHNGVSGYSWVSSACYTCHPTGNAK